MHKEYIDATDHMYSEPKALNALGEAVEEAVRTGFEREQEGYERGQFTITVSGKSIAFAIGGPQIEALYAFIECIATENRYGVDADGNYVDWKYQDE